MQVVVSSRAKIRAAAVKSLRSSRYSRFADSVREIVARSKPGRAVSVAVVARLAYVN